MLTPSLMAQMDPGHLIAAVHCEIDPLTHTALERELGSRLEARIDAHDDALTEAAEAYDFAAEDITILGDALIETSPSPPPCSGSPALPAFMTPKHSRPASRWPSSFAPWPTTPAMSSHAWPN